MTVHDPYRDKLAENLIIFETLLMSRDQLVLGGSGHEPIAMSNNMPKMKPVENLNQVYIGKKWKKLVKGIGNAIPPQLILRIRNGKQGKHEHRRFLQNLWGILTHQLIAYPLHQVERPQASTFKQLSDPKNDKSSRLQVWGHNMRKVRLWASDEL